MNIHRSPDGVRTVRVKREADRVIVARGRDGYVQDRYVYRGREFIHRTYYVHGRAYDRFYNRYLYRGVYLEGYAPVLYYPSFYYGWAYAPWPAPVPYAWVWIGNPWAVYYGPYFTPFTLYPSPAFWLTDYLISASLAAEYQAQLDAANGAVPQAFAAAPAPIAPEVQQAIAIEVQRQIALENSEAQQLAQNAPPDPASGGLVRMLTDNTSHIFVAGTGLAVSDANGPCDLSPGDVLQLSPPNPSLSADTSAATLVVLASKPQECPRGDAVSVQLTDLQDMQNYMRETMDQGLADLRATAGKGGLPAIPQAAKGPAAPAPFAVAATPPDPNAASEIAQQVQAADQAEREAAGYGQAQLAAGHAPPLIPEQGPLKNGMTIDQVEAELGKPARSFEAANHGMIYIYKNPTMKITFKDGKAVDVQ